MFKTNLLSLPPLGNYDLVTQSLFKLMKNIPLAQYTYKRLAAALHGVTAGCMLTVLQLVNSSHHFPQSGHYF
jgi:hypothetical protein